MGTEGEAKNKVETALEEEKRKKSAEKVLKKSRRRGDPNNPSKEEMDAAQELEQLTWQDRYMKNKRVKDVVSSSKMFSKVKNKLKLEKTEKELEVAPGISTETSSEDREKEAAKPVTTKPDLPGMIGSLLRPSMNPLRWRVVMIVRVNRGKKRGTCGEQ